MDNAPRDSVTAPPATNTGGRKAKINKGPFSGVARIDRISWSFWQIDEIPFKGSIDENDLDTKTDIDRYIDDYFSYSLKIFERRKIIPSKSWFHRNFVPTFVKSQLWPGDLEHRLKAINEERLAHTDNEIRLLIDDLVKVFSRNLLRFIVWKRVFQAVFVVTLVMGAAYVELAVATAPNFLRVAIPAVLFAVGATVNYLLFRLSNSSVVESYKYALTQSVTNVSNKVKDRINALSRLFSVYETKLQELHELGEDPKGADGTGRAGFYAEIILWLATRVEGIQFSLLYDLHIAQRRHYYINVAGFFGMLAIFVASGLVVWTLADTSYADALLVAIRTGSPGTLAPHITAISDSPAASFEPLRLARVAALVVTVLVTIGYTIRMSWMSYYYTGWSAAQEVLREKFETSEWQTFDRFGLHKTFGNRVGKAMNSIWNVRQDRKPTIGV